MADLIFPTENDVNGGTDEAGKAFTELTWQKLLQRGYASKEGSSHFGINFVRSGLTYTSAAGFVATFASGVCVIDGYYCELDSKTVTVSASDTFHVFAQLNVSGGIVTGADLIQQAASGTTVPARSCFLAHLTTGTTTVTADKDHRALSPHFKGNDYAGTNGAQNIFIGFRPSLVGIASANTEWAFVADGMDDTAPALNSDIAIQDYGFSVLAALSDSGFTYGYHARP
jgi:hypothetical protein